MIALKQTDNFYHCKRLAKFNILKIVKMDGQNDLYLDGS